MASLLGELDALTHRAWVESNDNLLRKHSQLARLLFKRAKKDKRTGAKIELSIRTKRPPVKRLSHALDTYPKAGEESHAVINFDWADYVATLQITGKQIRSQHGVNIQQLLKRESMSSLRTDEREVLMSVLTSQIEEGQEAIAEDIGIDIFNHRGVGGGIIGLPAIIDDSQQSYGGLAYNAAIINTTDDVTSTTYWEPYVDSNSGTLRDLTLELLGKGINAIRRGGESPESVVGVMNWDLYTELELMVEGSKDYRESRMINLGFDAIEWRHVTFLPDERAPNNKIYLLNRTGMWPDITWQMKWTESEANKPAIKAGTLAVDDLGSIWRYVQANAAIAKGDILMRHTNNGLVALLDTDITTAAAIGTRRITAAGLFTAANLKGGWFLRGTDYERYGHDYLIWTNENGTGLGQGGWVYNRDASDNYVDIWVINSTTGLLDVALTTSTDITAYTDSLVVKTAASAHQIPVGVAQKAITSGAFFWSLVKGYGIVGWDTGPRVLATDDQEIQNSSSTAGFGAGMTGTQTSIERRVVVGSAMTLDIDADGHMPINVDVLRNVAPNNSILQAMDTSKEWPERY